MANQDSSMDSTDSTKEVEEVYVDVVHGDSNATDAIALSAKMMQDPQALATTQERGDTRTTSPSVYMESLPKAVKRRVNALRNLQVKCAHIEAKFYKEVHELERKYAALYQPHFNRRREIVSGEVEPTDQDCEWVEEKDDDAEFADDLKEKVKLTEEQNDAESANPNGVPEFWLTLFRNVDLLSDMVQEHDEPILRHLQDISVKFSEEGVPMSFTLEFLFSTNEYFTNNVLTKTYVMKSEPDTSDPFSFEGPEIVSCTGLKTTGLMNGNLNIDFQVCKSHVGSSERELEPTEQLFEAMIMHGAVKTFIIAVRSQIDWKKGKDVTVKVIKKKQKHKGRGTVRTLTKTVPNDSFFNFFNPPQVSAGQELDEDSEVILTADFEIGHFFRERVVPRAVLYFTGEAIEDEEEYEEEEEEDEEDGQEEEGDDDDDDDDEKK